MEDDNPETKHTKTGGATYREATRQATHDAAMAAIEQERKSRAAKTERLKQARELVERPQSD